MTTSDLKSDSTVQPAIPRRRWYQFTLRTAGVWIALFCLLLGSFAWWRDRAERQRKVVEELMELRAKVLYRGYSLRNPSGVGYSFPDDEFPPFRFLVDRLRVPEDYLRIVDSVVLTESWGTDKESSEIKRRGFLLLERLPQIRFLELPGSFVSGDDLERLPFLESLEGLQIFNSTHNQGLLRDDDLMVLSRAPRLRKCRLGRQPIGDSGIKHLRNHRQMQQLSLDGTLITDAGLQHLCELTELIELDLSHTKITDAGLKHLRNLNQLWTLILDGNAIDGHGIGDLGPKHRLTTLRLSQTQIAESSLPNCLLFPRLQVLDLSNTAITSAGIPKLAGLRIYISLDGCPITDEGLAEIEVPDGVLGLSLRNTKITDIGFCKLRLPNSISSINFADTSVTDLSLDHLIELPSLQLVFTDGTQITSAAIKRFEGRKPSCRVIY